jgi:hypothetical protein
MNASKESKIKSLDINKMDKKEEDEDQLMNFMPS